MSWKIADQHDVLDVCADLRPADIREGRDMYGVDASITLPLTFRYSRTYVLYNDQGDNVALAGVAPTANPTTGQVWMVSKPTLYNHKIEFLRKSAPFIEELHSFYPILFNYVDARQEYHLKWLKWCGFSAVAYREIWGAAGIPFYEMVKVK